MYFQETTPDTYGYMIAGYTIAFLVLAIYVASIYLRNSNLKQDMEMLAEMEQPASMVEPKKKRPAKPVTKKSKKK